MEENAYWLGFSRISGIGRVTIEKLRAAFGTLERAWSAPLNVLRSAGLGEHLVGRVMTARRELDLAAELARIKALGTHLKTLADADYPALLRPLRAAPPVLYIRGSLTPADDRALAVVGTRKATRYGKDITTQFCSVIAQAGVTIVSGLAIGIDAAAHIAALDAGGRTLGVLGCGIDVVYPRENAALFHRILDNGQGALITQYPPGTRPDGTNFPRRNATLSGLALGVLVTEAPAKSGSLSTVGAALDQGRDVFVIPHSLHNQMGTGGNLLIRDGAKIALEPRDVLDELNISVELLTTRTATERIAPDSPQEAHVLAHLSDAPLHVDDLARATSLSIPELSTILTLLELKGLAQQVDHMQYCAMS
jgi:DNA processing protein